MSKIEFFHEIGKPVSVVRQAILEGFSVFKGNDTISNFTNDEHQFTANINTSMLSKKLDEMSFTVRLMGRNEIGNHTFLVSTINYSHRSKSVLCVVKRAFIRHHIKALAKIKLIDFKHRVEKWL